MLKPTLLRLIDIIDRLSASEREIALRTKYVAPGENAKRVVEELGKLLGRVEEAVGGLAMVHRLVTPSPIRSPPLPSAGAF